MAATMTQKAIRVQKVQAWPNNLGFECTVNGCRFSVNCDREIGRLSAWRVVNGELTKFSQIVDGGEWVDGLSKTAELVYRCWRDLPEDWAE